MEKDNGEEKIGLIKPPPIIRAIVDVTAGHVADKGARWEEEIRKRMDPVKFGFINPGHVYHLYYLSKVDELAVKLHRERSKPSQPDQDEPQESREEKEEQNGDAGIEPQVTGERENEKNAVLEAAPRLDVLSASLQKKRDDPPPEYIIKIYAHSCSQETVDVIRLTAKYASVLGETFIADTRKREAGNAEFDFLGPNHEWHPLFLAYVNAYMKTLEYRKSIKEFQRRFADRSTVLDRIVHRVDHEWKEQERRKEEEKKTESDIVAFNQIDWHDFVLVGTIDFNEMTDSQPVAITTEEDARNGKNLKNEAHQKLDDDEDEDDVDMDDDDDVDMVKGESLDVRTNYAPRVVSEATRKTKVVLPDGRAIETKDLNEHMRVETLDPKWREDRQKALERARTTNLESKGISKHLSKLAANRPDIFGAREKAMNSEHQDREKARENSSVMWDGQSSSVVDVRIAAMQRQARLSSSHDGQSSHNFSIGPQVPHNESQSGVNMAVNSVTQEAPGKPQLRQPLPPPLPPVPGVVCDEPARKKSKSK